ncbi:DNA topoisomerase-1 [Aminobacter aminovorans]|jgi:DNA topoisomerase-1|uniref:DNA topoisomerase n=1 Tax=Aminobacter aminovorans TaxID=83263 RepID=A0A380WHT5_AMIAI|nr:DNA topoisomerase IB [Aminobacter aminovorans]TCS27145.1 DNA topoisomerase-1 [Aminobacter aminovorans]SUU87796.1 Eukaryotic DNA topoisomerase I, catalytic core [Aminobacter aminovorans]
MRKDAEQTRHVQNGNVETAHTASLAYVSDDEPGISRKRAGKRFRYEAANGRKVVSKKVLARIGALAIPPAWTDVWICAESDGHIQATGRDQRGRKQYRYHPDWLDRRGELKFSSLAEFARALPRLRRQIDRDLRLRGPVRARVVAAIVWLLDNTMIRVGSAAYARENGSFGLTTLRNRHVDIEGSTLRFAFKGKSGKEWRLRLVDRRMAKVVRGIQELPGQTLFQYLDDVGARAPISSQDVNDYIRAAAGAAFSSKHFRTWGGTVRALTLFAQTPVPESERARARACNKVIDDVARHLGNTRAVCRTGYIHPEVISAWSEGRLSDELAACHAKRNPQLAPDERITLAWLSPPEKPVRKQ